MTSGASATATIASTKSPGTMQSASTKTRRSPRAARAPRFRPSPGPLRSPSRTMAPLAWASSCVPSVLPESATRISAGDRVWARRESSNAGRHFASFQVGTIMETGAPSGGPGRPRAAEGPSIPLTRPRRDRAGVGRRVVFRQIGVRHEPGEDHVPGESEASDEVVVLLHVRPGPDDHQLRVPVLLQDPRERVDQGGQVLLRRDAAYVQDDVMAVQPPLRPDALARDVRPEPLGVHARRDHVRDVRPRRERHDLVEDGAARDDDALGLPEEDLQVKAEAPLEQMEVEAERGVEREGVVDHRVERRDPGDLRLPGRPEALDPDEADPVDVDHVDPEVLDQVDLAAGEHREAVHWVMAELLRPDIYRAVLVRPAAAGVLRGEDHDLVPMGLELPAGR